MSDHGHENRDSNAPQSPVVEADELLTRLLARAEGVELTGKNAFEEIVFCGEVAGEGYVGWTPRDRAEANGWNFRSEPDKVSAYAAARIDELETRIQALGGSETHEAAFQRERGAIFSSGVGLARLALRDGDGAKALEYLDGACAEVHEAWWKALLADGYAEPLIEQFIGKRAPSGEQEQAQ